MSEEENEKASLLIQKQKRCEVKRRLLIAMRESLEMTKGDQLILMKEITYTARGAAMVKTARRENMESVKAAIFIFLDLRRRDVKFDNQVLWSN